MQHFDPLSRVILRSRRFTMGTSAHFLNKAETRGEQKDITAAETLCVHIWRQLIHNICIILILR